MSIKYCCCYRSISILVHIVLYYTYIIQFIRRQHTFCTDKYEINVFYY